MIYITIAILVFSIILILLHILKNRKNNNQSIIDDHKQLMLERINSEDESSKYTHLDFSLYEEHKNLLMERIRDEDWFARFIYPAYNKGRRDSVIQAFTKKFSGSNSSLEDILEVSNLQPVVIIGSGGSGKTTTLRKIAADLCTSPSDIPLLLQLASYQRDDDLIEMMNTERVLSRDLVQHILDQGTATVLVDQVNELPIVDIPIVLDKIQKLTSYNRHNRFILAVRTSGYLNIRIHIENFVPFEIQPLTINKIHEFLDNYLGEDAARQLLGSMDIRVKALCSSPLTLSMLASLYEVDKKIPKNKSELYDQFLYQILYNWDRKIIGTILDAYLDEVLAYIAFMVDPNVTAHPITKVQSIISERVPHLNDKYHQTYSTQEVADAILRLSLITLDRSSYKMLFLHQSIQEFLSSKYIYEAISSGSFTIDRLDVLLGDREWNEPLFFLSGLMANSSLLVSKLLDMRKIFLAAQCIHNSKITDTEIKDRLIVDALYEFKYGDADLNDNEAVSYDLIRALRLIFDPIKTSLNKRIIDDINFFINKYSLVKDYYTVIPLDEMSDDELITVIDNHINPLLEGDYIWSLGFRKCKKAVILAKKLISNQDYLFRDEAIWLIGEAGSSNDSLDLLGYLEPSESPQCIAAICNALIRIYAQEDKRSDNDSINQVVNGLIAYINQLSNHTREAAGWCLYNLSGLASKDIFIRHMHTGNNFYHRAMFVYLVGELKLRQALPELIEMYAKESEAHVREDIIFSIGAIAESIREDPEDDNLVLDTINVLEKSLEDTDAVVRLHGLRALQRLEYDQVEKIECLLNDKSTFIKIASNDMIRKITSVNHLLRKESNTLENLTQNLIQYGARATALANRMTEVDREYRSGILDIGRHTQLKTTLEQERLSLIVELQTVIRGTPMQVIEPALVTATTVGLEDDGEIRKQLTDSVHKMGLGDTVIEKIKEYKGEIVGLIISVALEVARRATGIP